MSIRDPLLVVGVLGAALVLAPSAHAASWTEVGDAGPLPATAEIPTGVGALDTIVGTIGFGDVDMYEIRLTGGGTFSAAASGAFPGFLDSQLYLFDSTGRGVYANDDTFPPNPFSPGGAVLPAGHPLTPLAPGIYFLAISSRDLEPVSPGGFIFPCVACTPGLVAAPTGPGGGSPISGWGGSPFTAGTYTITLTGAEFPPPPVVPFAAFSAKAQIDRPSREFEMTATFVLGAGSNGISPLIESVAFQLGTFSTTIPAGSFQQDKKGRLGFEGVINNVVLELTIVPLGGSSFAFKAQGEGADLSGTTNPVTVGLTINDDAGTVIISAEFE